LSGSVWAEGHKWEAACIGVFLLLLTPNMHEVAMIFIGIGALLILIGTFARRYFLR